MTRTFIDLYHPYRWGVNSPDPDRTSAGRGAAGAAIGAASDERPPRPPPVPRHGVPPLCSNNSRNFVAVEARDDLHSCSIVHAIPRAAPSAEAAARGGATPSRPCHGAAHRMRPIECLVPIQAIVEINVRRSKQALACGGAWLAWLHCRHHRGRCRLRGVTVRLR